MSLLPRALLGLGLSAGCALHRPPAAPPPELSQPVAGFVQVHTDHAVFMEQLRPDSVGGTGMLAVYNPWRRATELFIEGAPIGRLAPGATGRLALPAGSWRIELRSAEGLRWESVQHLPAQR